MLFQNTTFTDKNFAELVSKSRLTLVEFDFDFDKITDTDQSIISFSALGKR
jgi:hypothetical protein